MPLIKADRVKETSTSTGTGNFTLAGAATGFRTFASVCAVNDTVFYVIDSDSGSEWETGLGTYSAANTLTRTTVHASSNSGSLVPFSAGTKNVYISQTARQINTISAAPPAATGSPARLIDVTGAAHTALTASTEYSDVYWNLARTVQFSTGTITSQRAVRIDAPTYSFVGASTITDAVTMQIDGAPAAGTNATITNQTALRVITGQTSGKGIVVRGVSGQTANIQEWHDNSGNNFVSIPSPWNTGQGEIRLYELPANGSNFVALRAPSSIPSDITFTLPASNGSGTQYLANNGSGTLSWSTPSTGITGSGVAGNIPVFQTSTSLANSVATGSSSSSVVNFNVDGSFRCRGFNGATSPLPALEVSAYAQTGLSAFVNRPDVLFSLARTVQHSNISGIDLRAFIVDSPTYSTTSAQTVPNAITMEISSAPLAGTNITITNQISLRILTGSSAAKGIVIRGAASQSANLEEWQDSTGSVLSAIRSNGAIQPATLADSAAANNSIYYSSTAGKLVYKDSAGTVNNLY